MKKILALLMLALCLAAVAPTSVKAASGYATTKAFTLTVAAPLVISTATALPAAVAGQTYSVTFAATGGVGPYTWTVATGSTLPAGLTLTAGGVLSGTPTTAGSYAFSITVTDGIQTATVKVSPPTR